MTDRLCTRCKVAKPIAEFRKSSGRKDGLHTYCNDCHTQYVRQRLAKKRIDDKLQQRAYTANQYAIIHGVEGEITKDDVRTQLDIQKGCCYYCGATLDLDGKDYKYSACVEHMIPMSRGGMNVADNIVMSCKSCNAAKRSKTADQFISLLMNN